MAGNKILKTLWNISILGGGAALLILTFSGDFKLAEYFPDYTVLFLIIAAIAFFAEYVDSSLGMGYGTTLTPLLLILGFSPLQIVPSILFSEFISGISAGFLHHKAKNADFSENSRAFRILILMSSCAMFGTFASVFLALSLPKSVVKLYIALMVMGVGLLIFFGGSLLRKFSWSKLAFIGTLAAFNKGISGGGFGPLVTGGQILSGVKEKEAVSITSMTEGLVCCAGFLLYLASTGEVYWKLAAPLSIGAFISVPAAVWTVKILPENRIRGYIGYVTLFLGTLSLLKLIV